MTPTISDRTITNTKTEIYDLDLDGKSFEVHYIQNSIGEDDGTLELLDDHALLKEKLRNKYPNPKEGKLSQSYKIKTETVREVSRGFCPKCLPDVEINQWRDIPDGLEKLIDTLPDHVKELLTMEYDNPNIFPRDWGYPVK